MGGEYGGAVLMTVEHSGERKGFLGSLVNTGATAGLILANVVFLAVFQLPEDHLMSWGWRVPFLLSGILVVIGLVARVTLEETPPDFEKAKQHSAIQQRPLVDVLTNHTSTVLLLALGIVAAGTAFTMTTVYSLSYGTTVLGLSSGTMLAVLLPATVTILIGLPLFGALADRIGVRKVFLGGAASLVVLPFCWFALMETRQYGMMLLGFALLFVGYSANYAVVPAYFSQVFPRVRAVHRNVDRTHDRTHRRQRHRPLGVLAPVGRHRWLARDRALHGDHRGGLARRRTVPAASRYRNRARRVVGGGLGGGEPLMTSPALLRHGFADTRHGQVHYVRQGHGLPVLLLHQTPRSWDEYRDVIPILARDFHVIAMDTLGFGSSTRPPTPWTVETFAEGVLDLCDELGLGSFALVGHHTGAVVAVEVAATRPDRIEHSSCRACRSSMLPPDGAPSSNGRPSTRRPTARRLPPAAAVEQPGPPVLPIGPPGPARPAGARCHRRSRRGRTRHVAVNRYRMEDRIGAITAPTLAVCGGEHDEFSLPDQPRIVGAIPGARATVLPRHRCSRRRPSAGPVRGRGPRLPHRIDRPEVRARDPPEGA